MAMNEEKNIDVVVNTYDRTGPGLKRAREALNAFDKSIEKTKDQLSKMAKSEFKVIMEAIDQISPVARRAKAYLSGFSGGRPYRITLDALDKVSKVIGKTRSGLTDLTARAWTITMRTKEAIGSKAGGAINSGLAAVTGMGSSMLAGAGVAYGGYDTVKTFMDFEAQMSEIKALTGLQDNAMEQVNQKALDLGKSTAFSATEVGQGMSELLKAGISVEDVLGNATEAALNLATAGDLALSDAAEIMSTAMNAFHMDDAVHAADILAGAANASATSVGDLKYALSSVAAVAAGMGMGFDDVNTALAVLAQNGLKGSDAGTSLKSMLMNLIPKTKTQIGVFEKLGWMTEQGSSAFFDAAGNMKSMAEIADMLKDSLKDLTAEERASLLEDAFGSDAIRAGQIFSKDGAAGIKAMFSEMSKITAKDVADEKLNNLKGDIEQLGGAWETFQVILMQGSGSTGLRNFFQSATEVLGSFTESIRDGLDFNDIVQLAIDVLDRLFDKFTKLDGVGSMLAGGTLLFGLAQVYGKAKDIYEAIQNILQATDRLPGEGGEQEEGGGIKDAYEEIKGMFGSDEDGDNDPKLVQEMVVHAKTVIINGGGNRGGRNRGNRNGRRVRGEGPDRPGRDGRQERRRERIRAHREQPPLNENLPQGRTSGWRGKLGGMAKATGKIAVPLDIAFGLYDLYNAADGEKMAAAGNMGGGLIGGLTGAKAGAALGGAIGSVVPGAGTAVGAAVGGAAGGIGGYVFGRDLGEQLGGMIGDFDWGSKFESLKEQVGDALNDGINIAVGALDAAGLWEPLTQGAEAASVSIQNNLGWARNSISEQYADLASWFDETAWNPLSTRAGSVASEVSSKFNEGKSWIMSHWSDLGSWFDSEIWGPLKSKASGIFEGISNKISALRDKGASITGIGDGSNSDNETPHAWGGIMSVPHVGLVAEAGPEAIIPLGSGRRGRGIDLWQKAGQMLGVDFGSGSSVATPIESMPYIAPEMNNDTAPFIPSLSVAQSNNAPTSVPDVNVQVTMTPTFEISGGEGMSSESIMAVVKAHAREMADEIGGELAEKLVGIFGNQPLKVG